MRYFSWDKNKARANKQKHGVDFEDAVLVFNDPLAVRDFNRNVAGEIRWRTIGTVKGFGLTLALGIICDLVTLFVFKMPLIRLLANGSFQKHPVFWGINGDLEDGHAAEAAALARGLGDA